MPSTQTNSIADDDPVAQEAPLVLLVEDNTINARLTTDMLRSAGYRTQLAVDGDEGLRLARELKPDLILTDLQMPRVDGLTLARMLKQDPSTAAIPIIAVTAHAMAEHCEDAAQAGCCAFIAKPFRFREFLAEVAHALKSRH